MYAPCLSHPTSRVIQKVSLKNIQKENRNNNNSTKHSRREHEKKYFKTIRKHNNNLIKYQWICNRILCTPKNVITSYYHENYSEMNGHRKPTEEWSVKPNPSPVEVYFSFCCLTLDFGIKFQRFSITENIISWRQAFAVLQVSFFRSEGKCSHL